MNFLIELLQVDELGQLRWEKLAGAPGVPLRFDTREDARRELGRFDAAFSYGADNLRVVEED